MLKEKRFFEYRQGKTVFRLMFGVIIDVKLSILYISIFLKTFFYRSKPLAAKVAKKTFLFEENGNEK